MQQETAPNVNPVPGLLKVFVIIGGIALVFGTILLVVLVMLRAGEDSPVDQTVAPGAQVDLALPAGMRVRQVIADGRRLVLLGENQEGQQYIAVVDTRTGTRESLIRLAPSP